MDYRVCKVMLGDPMLFSELAEFYAALESVSSRLKMMDIMARMFSGLGISEVSAAVYMTEGVLLPPFEGIEFGVAEKLMEAAIAKGAGYERKEVNELYKKLGDLGTTAEALKTKSRLRRMRDRKYTVTDVYTTMLSIAKESGQGSKDKKIAILADLIASSTPQEAKYLVRYPLGALRLGAGDSTILEALSVMESGERKIKGELEHAYNICSDLGLVAEELKRNGKEAITKFKVTLFKPIRPALAERLSTGEEIIAKMGGEKVSVEQKYDGFRCQIHKEGTKVKIYSRRLEETTAMFPDIVKAALEEIKSDDVILEGEALAFNEATAEFMPFQETIQRKRKHGIEEAIETMPLRLFAFDIMYLNGKDLLCEPYEKRRAVLEDLLSRGRIIRPSTRIVTDSPKELEEFFSTSIENGLEGIIAKDLSAEYIAGARKFSWIKLKRSYRGKLSDTVDLVIVGYYLGRGSRAEFKFGGLLCATYNKRKDVFETISRIGSGFTEKQMTELKERLDKIKLNTKPARLEAVVVPDFWVEPRYVVTVLADEITKSPTHTCFRHRQTDGEEEGYALRFPRIVGEETIRQDKGPEEATTSEEIDEMYRLQKRVAVGKMTE
jgi:DNA ligase-1